VPTYIAHYKALTTYIRVAHHQAVATYIAHYHTVPTYIAHHQTVPTYIAHYQNSWRSPSILPSRVLFTHNAVFCKFSSLSSEPLICCWLLFGTHTAPYLSANKHTVDFTSICRYVYVRVI